MKRILIVAAALLLAVSASASKPRELVIVHFNDTHSHLDPEFDGTGGILERAAFVDSLRQAYGRRNVLLLHGGDFEQGSSYFTILKGDLEISLANALKYDCMVLGNHEFDNGIEDLGRRLSMLKCPVVCANYDLSSFEAGKYASPYVIVRKAGMKIGIIGILCDLSAVVLREISDRIPALGTVESVNRYADYLKHHEHCDMVIVLSHAGFKGEAGKNDTDIVPLTHSVDLVVGGHSHTKLDSAFMMKDQYGRQVPIVQDWCWGLEAGVMKVKFD